MSASDSRSVLIDSLRMDGDDWKLSNIVLPKPASIKAVQYLFRLREDMLAFAIDPQAAPDLPLPPTEPSLEGLSEEEAETKYNDYRKKFSYWLMIRDAHNRKVPLDKYLMIEEYFTPYFKTLEATRAIKGVGFKAFTKTGERPQQKQGILGSLMGGQRDE